VDLAKQGISYQNVVWHCFCPYSADGVAMSICGHNSSPLPASHPLIWSSVASFSLSSGDVSGYDISRQKMCQIGEWLVADCLPGMHRPWVHPSTEKKKGCSALLCLLLTQEWMSYSQLLTIQQSGHTQSRPESSSAGLQSNHSCPRWQAKTADVLFGVTVAAAAGVEGRWVPVGCQLCPIGCDWAGAEGLCGQFRLSVRSSKVD
jgi:hypothetical protein